MIAEHLEPFLRAVAEAGDGAGLPQFVEREFREFLLCGVYEAGAARFQCEGCACEHLVPFSCKGRGWCPSCGGRRMTERAAHLVDAVLPWVPVRQWVLTVPYRLRDQMAWNHGLSRAVLAVHAGAADVYARRPARGIGVGDGHGHGAATRRQRLNVNLHFHTSADGGVQRRARGHPGFTRRRPSDARSRWCWPRCASGCSGCWCAGPGPTTTRRGRGQLADDPVLAGIVGARSGAGGDGPARGARVRRLGHEHFEA